MYLQIRFQVLDKHIKSKRDQKIEAQMDVTVSKVGNTDLIIVTTQHTLKLFSFFVLCYRTFIHWRLDDKIPTTSIFLYRWSFKNVA